MKKMLLLGGMLSAVLFANAQQRLVLYESFSGENCGPCAGTNPPFWDFLNNATNAPKVILLKYQVNIPQASVHPLYDQNITEAEARRSYYGVNSAPNGRIDGRLHHPGTSAGHPANYLQAGGQDSMNTEINRPSPFNITVTPSISGNTVSAQISVTAASAFTGTNMKLRVALVESLHYSTPPGSNGEVDFHNVMRKMYPGTDGTAFPNTWTNGQNQVFNISGDMPAYVDKAAEVLFLLVWIQDDGNKQIAQAAKATLPAPAVDVKSLTVNGPLNCGLNPFNPKVTIKNTGTSALTSAQIYYRIGTSGAWSVQPWSGSLAAGATQEVTITTPLPAAVGYRVLQDSVAMPNAAVDINPINNTSATAISTVANTSGQALPISTDFEGTTDNWVPFSAEGNAPLAVLTVTGNKAYNGSAKALVYPCYSLAAGQVGYNILPYGDIPAGAKALDFYTAYAPYSGTGDFPDKMEVIYSTNCGGSWTTVWTGDKTTLTSAPGTQNSFIPSGNDQWKMRSIDMSAVPANAQVGFRVTSGFGNNLFIDNVNFRIGTPTGVEELISGGDMKVFPNPATEQLNVELNMVKTAKVSFNIVNLLGQSVGQSVEKTLTSGQQITQINTSDLAPGVYFLNIATESGKLQQKFVKK